MKVKIHRAVIIAAILSMLLAPIPLIYTVLASSDSAPRASGIVGTSLGFDNGNVVTFQYSKLIWFCNQSSGSCVVGQGGPAPVAENATNVLAVIIPAFLHPICDLLTKNNVPESCLSSAGFITSVSNPSVFDASLGFNNFAQCPDIVDSSAPEGATCPNHPTTIDLSSVLPYGLGVGVIPLPIHSHIISGHGVAGGQGGWWEVQVYLVLNPNIWPNPSSGQCTSSTPLCLNSFDALNTAVRQGMVVGPVPTNLYLFFSVTG
jgi:hypothetical protein